jgi:glycosyltransferase involved in cell wall biosynthesis
MNILQINTSDRAGGAEKIALTLDRGYQEKNYNSWLAVGRKKLDDKNIIVIPKDLHLNLYSKFFFKIGNLFAPHIGKIKGAYHLYILFIYILGQPLVWLKLKSGHEYFPSFLEQNFLSLIPSRLDIIHCHNLHSGEYNCGHYFNLNLLSKLSQKIPVVITLHDAWLLSGHCAHSFDCDRWKIGCGNCPDLSIYPTIPRDNTALNWQVKKQIYQQSKLYIATPSQWLMDKVEESILKEAVVESRVIPNGIDLSIFYPTDKHKLRQQFNFPNDAKIVIFTANGIRQNIWKDYQMMREAIALVAKNLPQENIIFLAVGENSPPEKLDNATIQFIPYQDNPQAVASYYQIADVYLHAAKADTFPTTILEALACGTPVVATKVGGIPEQIEHGNTGFLVSAGDAVAMAGYIQKLLEDKILQQNMRQQAALVAKQKYSLERMVTNYLIWYEEIVENFISIP